MRLVDWRDAGLDGFPEIWQGLSTRWTERLGWDTQSTWTTIDAQRRAGELPGLAIADGARVAAWSFFGVHRETLQVGAFESDSLASTRGLLDAVLSVGEPEIAPAGTMAFMFSDAPGLVEELHSRGFETDRYLYLMRQNCSTRPASAGVSSGLSAVLTPEWDERLIVQVPALFGRAYGEPHLTRPFVRHGEPEEWHEYVTQLLGSDACGRFEPRLSAARISAQGELEAVVIATVIGPTTAHIAQVAVAPERRGHGLAKAMVDEVLARAGAEGFTSVSLLVGERNAGARHVYESCGFRGTESFLSAGRRG